MCAISSPSFQAVWARQWINDATAAVTPAAQGDEWWGLGGIVYSQLVEQAHRTTEAFSNDFDTSKFGAGHLHSNDQIRERT
jgi:hypothetical protein